MNQRHLKLYHCHHHYPLQYHYSHRRHDHLHLLKPNLRDRFDNSLERRQFRHCHHHYLQQDRDIHHYRGLDQYLMTTQLRH